MPTDERIEDLNEILDDGVKKTTVNGESVEYDLEVVRQRRRELTDQDPETPVARPRVSRLKMGGSL